MILFSKINYHLFELTKDAYIIPQKLINMIKKYIIKKYFKKSMKSRNFRNKNKYMGVGNN